MRQQTTARLMFNDGSAPMVLYPVQSFSPDENDFVLLIVRCCCIASDDMTPGVKVSVHWSGIRGDSVLASSVKLDHELFILELSCTRREATAGQHFLLRFR